MEANCLAVSFPTRKRAPRQQGLYSAVLCMPRTWRNAWHPGIVRKYLLVSGRVQEGLDE